ncbi:MAG: 1-acyl-sn-glycerol-3-phosphate acyltransferase [Chroococcales cyanobacterium]
MSVSDSKPQFYPPQRKSVFIRIIQALSFAVVPIVYRMDLEIEPSSLEKLRAIESKRLVLLPNHPTLDDGISIFLLSAYWGQLFYYLIAYDSFKGLLGKVLQWLGGYSIKRGLGDRKAISQTINLLQKPDCCLVIFPEGGCSYQNDTVMPFRGGAIQFPMQAMTKLAKEKEILPDFYLVPVSFKYRYRQKMNLIIDQTLKQLEDSLQIRPSSWDFYERLRAIAEKVISQLEQEYGLENLSDRQDLNPRLNRLKNHVLTLCEEKLNITPPDQPPRERVYKIQSVVESRAEEASEEEMKTYEFINKSTFRLLNFDAMYDGYVAESPTPERFLDTLTRLEREVWNIDKPSPKAYRKVLVRIGDPVNLKDYFEAYQKDKSQVIEDLTQQLQEAVQHNLDLLNERFPSVGWNE